MQNDIRINEMRRNDVAIKTNAGTKRRKTAYKIFLEFLLYSHNPIDCLLLLFKTTIYEHRIAKASHRV